MESLSVTPLKYKSSYYIEVSSFKDFEKISLSATNEIKETMPRIKMIQPKLEARTKNGKYFLKIDRECVKLLDKMMADPALKLRLLTNKQAQAIAFNDIKEITGEVRAVRL